MPSVSAATSVPSIGGSFSTSLSTKCQSISLLFGESGVGKSAFAFGTPDESGKNIAVGGAPGPIAQINLDGRDKLVYNKAVRAGRVIHRAPIIIPAALRPDQSDMPKNAAGKRAEDDLDEACKTTKRNFWASFDLAVEQSNKGAIRTIIVDTGSELTDVETLVARGHLGGTLDKGRSKNRVNLAMQRLFLKARSGKAHLVILARSREKWKNNKPTGISTIVGNEKLWEFADWVGEMSLRRGPVSDRFEGFQVTIRKSGGNIVEEGATYTDQDWGSLGPFVYCCMKQYPGEDPANWID